MPVQAKRENLSRDMGPSHSVQIQIDVLLEVREDLDPKCALGLVSTEGSAVIFGAGPLIYFKWTLYFPSSFQDRIPSLML